MEGSCVHKILFFTPSLDYGGSVKQLYLVAKELVASGSSVAFATWAAGGPYAQKFREAGVQRECLAWKRVFDVRPLIALRRLIHSYQPTIFHQFGGRPLDWAQIAALGVKCPIILTPDSSCSLIQQSWTTSVRCKLTPAHAIVLGHSAAMDRFMKLNLTGKKVVRIAPAVPLRPSGSAFNQSIKAELNLPAGSRLIACVGPFREAEAGIFACWAGDILRFLYEQLHLIFIGEGTGCERIRQFARSTKSSAFVHFVGTRPDVLPLMAEADVVWTLDRNGQGCNVALEAMSMGKPVVAVRSPGLSEIVVDGETGFVVPPNDRVALARQTKALLDDADIASKLGEAGRHRAETVFDLESTVQSHKKLYISANG